MTVAALEKTDYDVLNTITLKKMATPAAVVRASGRDTAEVETAFERLAAQGLVAVASGAALPTDEAEPALLDAAARIYASVRTDPLVGSLVEKFETVNRHFLKTMSSWQLIDAGGKKIANTHTDSAYDDKVVFRLGRLIQQLVPLLDALAEHDRRFAMYQRRFTAATHAVDRGEHELVSSPTADSIHNIWFEFHEDLLRTLGRERAE
ncbi:hypothetical protein G3I59_01470 [Amycolatopsis rubida]|uniref:Uncharacterized protein n=1 Tax=Amycolatopsis rubida TaxID=112413 RepID=A0A1I5VG60_9PSEU|nr:MULTISPECIES: hypothetical protein [Amycolatopsis]MYW89337.1 hypothetical protein [Amycolatopsis rubida]NEC54315.1 hypothetical protein [Amycolatopsis rubida]OAP21086.1 hypothetical protein A4R44_08061 [Amycolatopsis sp. M39]SFQ06337.1 hypothetical protein SAMN05421854_108333 [Amycolatopsis rubida]